MKTIEIKKVRTNTFEYAKSIDEDIMDITIELSNRTATSMPVSRSEVELLEQHGYTIDALIDIFKTWIGLYINSNEVNIYNNLSIYKLKHRALITLTKETNEHSNN